MRITLGMMTNTVKSGLMNSADRLLEAQQYSVTGKKISRPSDDVPGVGRSLNYRSVIASIEQFKRNSDISESLLSMTSSTLDAVIKQLQDVRKAAIESGGPAITDEARAAIGIQLDQIMENLAGLGNTQHLGKFIFAGGASKTEPFVVNAGGSPPYNYQGDNSTFLIQVGPGVYIPSNVTGDMVFNIGGTSLPSVPDIFETIRQVKEAVLAGDNEDLSAHINDIQANLDNVIAIRSQIGARVRQLETTQDALLDTNIKVKELLSKTEDADLAETIVELRTRENVYQAAIATASRLLQTSLADFLR